VFLLLSALLNGEHLGFSKKFADLKGFQVDEVFIFSESSLKEKKKSMSGFEFPMVESGKKSWLQDVFIDKMSLLVSPVVFSFLFFAFLLFLFKPKKIELNHLEIFLFGRRGCGKSSVGRALSRIQNDIHFRVIEWKTKLPPSVAPKNKYLLVTKWPDCLCGKTDESSLFQQIYSKLPENCFLVITHFPADRHLNKSSFPDPFLQSFPSAQIFTVNLYPCDIAEAEIESHFQNVYDQSCASLNEIFTRG
jgi:hypothetical protein